MVEDSDLIIWEYRQHPKAALAKSDRVERPKNADWLSDEVSLTTTHLQMTNLPSVAYYLSQLSLGLHHRLSFSSS